MTRSSVDFDLFTIRSSHRAGPQHQMKALSGVRATVLAHRHLCHEQPDDAGLLGRDQRNSRIT